MIKYIHYFPRGVCGDITNKYFSKKMLSSVVCIIGGLNETDFTVFVLKDSYYNIIIMSAFSVLTVTAG